MNVEIVRSSETTEKPIEVPLESKRSKETKNRIDLFILGEKGLSYEQKKNTP